MKNPYLNSNYSVADLLLDQQKIKKQLEKFDGEPDIYITKDIYKAALNNIQEALEFRGAIKKSK
jgi:hypothetical protein